MTEFESDQELEVSIEFEALDLIQIQPSDWYNGSFVRSKANGPFKKGYSAYSTIYEPAIQRLIREKQLTPEYFHAQKGDILIWHANLIHGGSRRKQCTLSRKSIVCHYFSRGAVCYHDLAGVRADSRRTSDYGEAMKDMLM